MFSLIFSLFCFASNSEQKLIKKINNIAEAKYTGTVIQDSLTQNYLGKIVAPSEYTQINTLIKHVDTRYKSDCNYKTQYVYLLKKQEYVNIKDTLATNDKKTAFNYDMQSYPAQLKIVCFNCENNVNSDLESLYLKDIKNCTQGG